MEVKVIDNFLDEIIFNQIVEYIIPQSLKNFTQNDILNWVYSRGVSYSPEDEKRFVNESFQIDDIDLYNYQFINIGYNDNMPRSKLFDLSMPILEKARPISVVKIKANLQPRADKIVEFPMHVDIQNFKGKTAIFYLNTNDGYTLFENGQKVESIANRYVEFDSTIKHTGTTCTDQKRRVVINFNYE